ncbi:right-handed parallel beta-helix repeat-containing protein, partial [Planctomycetota bacterium]
MKKMLVTLLLVMAVGIYAADIYVSPAGGGSGASPGDETDAESGIQAAQPGDTVYFRGTMGTYSVNLKIEPSNGVADGTAADPIECKPYNSESVLFSAGPSENCFDISCSYWILRDFEITGYSNAVKTQSASYILLDNLYVHNTGSVGIDFKGATHHITVKNCEVAFPGGSGECFYIGSSDSFSSNICSENVIKNCYIHDTIGTTQGDGVELKPLCWGNVIRDNVIHSTNYPGILAVGNYTQATPNVIEGNVIWNVKEWGIDVCSRAIVKNNIVFNCDSGGIKLRSNSDSGHTRIQSVKVISNTCFDNIQVTPSAGTYRGEIHIADALELRDVVIANNIFYGTNSSQFALSLYPHNNEPHNTTEFITNRYYHANTTHTVFVNQTGQDNMNLADWQAYLASKNIVEGDDSSSYGLPGFANPVSNVPGADFYLNANITGTYSAEAIYDIDGVVRDNPPTIG